MPEYIATTAHSSNLLNRPIAVGEPVEIPEEEAKRNPHLYDPRQSRGGKPSLEDLINKALQMNLGKEADLKKMSYAELAAAIKARS